MKRKVIDNDTVNYELHRSLVTSGCKIHESICGKNIAGIHWLWLNYIDEYSITISCKDLIEYPYLSDVKDKIQVSVYSIEDINYYKDWQKLFLIKNKETFDIFLALLGKDTGKLHFVLDQKWLDKNKLPIIITEFNNKASKGQSLDSCLTSWILNGECPLMKNNYIDINFDHTVRSCPYSEKGITFKNKYPIDKLFGLKTLPQKCLYMEIFGEELNGKISNTCIQSYVANRRQ